MSDVKNNKNKERNPKLSEIITADPAPSRMGVLARLRTYFLTGLVVAAPISITIYLTWSFITLIDVWIKPFVPVLYNPDTYLPFSMPGVGLVFALMALTVLGALTANLFGRTIVAYGEQMFNRMPVVRNIYKALKQIFETALSQSSSSFQDVALIEYPRKGLFAIVFVSTETKGEIPEKSGVADLLSVFLPTTPNPTSGYLLFVPREDVVLLDMSVEEGAKLVISAGLVLPDDGESGDVPALSAKAAERITANAKPAAKKPARRRKATESVD